MPGPPPKPPDQRQRANRPHNLGVIPGGLTVVAPNPPEGVLQPTRDAWDRYWGSDLAKLCEPDTDGEAIARLFTLYDQRRRAFDASKSQLLVEGSQGQPVLNPLVKYVESLDKEIRALEDRFGLTPKARLALGIAFGEMTKSLDDLNRTLGRDENGGDEDKDPRIQTA